MMMIMMMIMIMIMIMMMMMIMLSRVTVGRAAGAVGLRERLLDLNKAIECYVCFVGLMLELYWCCVSVV
jgi:hypothetical protein